jgi:hypothetical protein
VENRKGHAAAVAGQAERSVPGDEVVDGMASGDLEEDHNLAEVEEEPVKNGRRQGVPREDCNGRVILPALGCQPDGHLAR